MVTHLFFASQRIVQVVYGLHLPARDTAPTVLSQIQAKYKGVEVEGPTTLRFTLWLRVAMTTGSLSIEHAEELINFLGYDGEFFTGASGSYIVRLSLCVLARP